MNEYNELEIIEKCHTLSFLHALLTDPTDPRVILQEVKNEQRGITRYSKVNRKYLYKRLQASQRLSTTNAPRGVGEKLRKRREMDWRRYERVYEEGSSKEINDWLRYRFEKNKEHCGIKGEWKLSDEDIEYLFNEPIKLFSKTVTLRTIGNQIMLMRIDSKGDVCLENIRVIYRRRRKRRGLTGKMGMKKEPLKKGKPPVLWEPSKLKHRKKTLDKWHDPLYN